MNVWQGISKIDGSRRRIPSLGNESVPIATERVRDTGYPGYPGIRDRSFDTLEDAKAWLRRSSTDQERGEFVDPRDGSMTLADYVEQYWMPGVRGGAKTRKSIDERVRLHVRTWAALR
jgi:hypothetical protein